MHQSFFVPYQQLMLAQRKDLQGGKSHDRGKIKPSGFETEQTSNLDQYVNFIRHLVCVSCYAINQLLDFFALQTDCAE